MSRDNVELVRRAYDAMNRQDLSIFPEICWPDFEVHPVLSFDQEAYRGREQLEAAFFDFAASFDELTFEADDFLQVSDDRVVASVRQYVRGRHSGAGTFQQRYHVWTVRHGKLARMEIYASRSEALEAAGPGR